MIFAEYVHTSNKKVFKVSARIIWFSSLFMCILASIPKIRQLHITFTELLVDGSIAFLYSLFVWYYNLYSLPKFTSQHITTGFFNRRLVLSLAFGIVLMIALVSGHQLLFSKYHFGEMMLMYQFRGILINLTIYMFIHLLYQAHRAQQIGVELERSKADNLGAQYELLKQQVNPHFLFNSLNTLKSMIDINDPHSADFIMKLSDFYRFSLENRKMDLIPLSEELDILNAYMFLLKARFEEGICLSTELSDQHKQSYIPPFTLQLLVENCVKHNVISLNKPLHIRLYSAGDSMVIENQLQLKKTPEASTRMGLENINQRYLHHLSKKIEVTVDDVLFKVKLPVIYEYRNY
jgi:two-component system LytT family sensor kinase